MRYCVLPLVYQEQRIAQMTPKLIVAFSERYGVSPDGTIYNLRTGQQRVCEPNNCGYWRFSYTENGKRIRVFIHRLVAETFLSKRAGLDQVDHLDGDRNNNALHNLRWCNQSTNIRHSYAVVRPKRAAGLLPADPRSDG